MYFMFFSSPWLFLGFQNPHHAIISWPRRQLVDFLACTSRDVTWMCKKLESFCSNVCLVFSLLTNVFDAQEVSQKKRYLCSWRSFCDALKQSVWSLSCEHCDLWMTDVIGRSKHTILIGIFNQVPSLLCQKQTASPRIFCPLWIFWFFLRTLVTFSLKPNILCFLHCGADQVQFVSSLRIF